MRGLAALLLPAILQLAACQAGGAPPACPAGTAPAAVAELAFGRNGPAGSLRVTDPDWDAFLAEEVTPRFPDGLTSFDAMGQWRGRDGRTAREPSKLLWLVVPDTTLEEAGSRTRPIAAAYRRRFGQEAVLAVYRGGCAAVLGN
ncbi:DUF3574 domain-containing protein [Roseomonas indoligenes]|uniref:DUF3574 domain-containing protein n=1 Tax=Roseomonas indoligenes TaxID=2820811 RepID=A0A940S6U7_9PROT|nr:DUF3574 domain-containing protein [Pararoseomonas indoligenes]MBP0492417.1 DUF3574 domain-containing protein [Pararoseomonas indoligenes]